MQTHDKDIQLHKNPYLTIRILASFNNNRYHHQHANVCTEGFSRKASHYS